VRTISAALVHTVESASDALGMEKVVKLFSTAFARVCALRVVDEVVVDGLTVGWRRLEGWPCWGSGRAVAVGAAVVRDCGFGWVVPEAAFLDPYLGEQLKMAARIFSGRL
jgi:hypothetical protein